jgi:hypothetical protein
MPMKNKRKPASAAAGTPSAPKKKPRDEDPVEGRTRRSQTVPTVPHAPACEGGERRSGRLAAKAQVAHLPIVHEGKTFSLNFVFEKLQRSRHTFFLC